MAQTLISGETKSIDYFAKTDGDKTTKTVTQEGDQAPADNDYFTINNISLSNADNGTKYHCQGLYTITAKITDNSNGETDKTSELKEQVQDADGRLYLKTKAGSGVTVNITGDQDGNPNESKVESINHTLRSLISQDAGTKFWVTYDFTSTGSKMDAELQAAFKISNANANQNYLADKKITVTITPDSSDKKLTCIVIKYKRK